MIRANKSITTLNLIGNNIGDDGALALVKMLVPNKTLTDISLSTNKMNKDTKRIANILGTNESLTILNLAYFCIGDDGALGFTDVIVTTPRRKKEER